MRVRPGNGLDMGDAMRWHCIAHIQSLIFATLAMPVTVNCWCGTPTLLTEFCSLIIASQNAEFVLVAVIFDFSIFQLYVSLCCLQGLFISKKNQKMPLAINMSLRCLKKQTCLLIWQLYCVHSWFSICMKFNTVHYWMQAARGPFRSLILVRKWQISLFPTGNYIVTVM